MCDRCLFDRTLKSKIFLVYLFLLQLSSGNPKELFPTSSSKSLEPSIARYSETSFLLGRDQTSVLVEEAKEESKEDGKDEPKDEGKENKIVIKKTIKWKEAPISVGR